jgi:hypothetical protein
MGSSCSENRARLTYVSADLEEAISAGLGRAGELADVRETHDCVDAFKIKQSGSPRFNLPQLISS